MSERDLKRVEVLSEVQSGRRTVAAAASVLGASERQAYRLLARYQENGGFGLVHKARGRESNRSHNLGIRKYAVELVKTHYADFGPALATEALEERHSIYAGRETLRRWMMADGVWLSRKQRKTFHQPRLRRESYGELVQIDGSEHRRFENRGEPCTLLVFIDDATSRLMQLRFVPSESTASYFEALEGYLRDHGCPVAFYSDKHSIFRVNRPEAKGGRHNQRFAVPPTRTQDLHRPPQMNGTRLDDILCHREQRYVGAQLTFHYNRKQIILEPTELSKGLAGRYVDLFDFASKPMEVRWKEHTLPYRVFSKDQRVSHAAIVENKRLEHALTIVKAQQDLKREIKVMTNSEKTGYTKNPRAIYVPDFVEKTRSRRDEELD